MDRSKMSDMTKEKHADFLLKFSCNMMTAFYVTVAIAPLGIILTQAIKGSEGTNESLYGFLLILSGWKGVAFITLELLIYYLAITSQTKSYEIYDSLYSDNHKKRFKTSHRLSNRSKKTPNVL